MNDQARPGPQAGPQPGAVRVDDAFLASANEFIQLANRLAAEKGLEHVSVAALFAAARFNSHVFLATTPVDGVAGERDAFFEHMLGMYRKMLTRHLDGQGKERGIDVGAAPSAANDDQGSA